MNDNLFQTMIVRLRDQLTSLYGDRLVSLFLFGSQARGEAQSESDIDILVILKGIVSPGIEIARTGPLVSRLSLQHDRVISLTFVSADRFAHENTPLFLNVRREGVSL